MSDANNNQQSGTAESNGLVGMLMRPVKKIETSLRSRRKRRPKTNEPIEQSDAGPMEQSAAQSAYERSKASAEGPLSERKASRKFKERSKDSKDSKDDNKEEKSMRNSIRQSMKNFKDRRVKELVQVKTFISRPCKTVSQKLLTHVMRRKELRANADVTSERSDRSRLKEGDDYFPTVRKSKSSSVSETPSSLQPLEKAPPEKAPPEKTAPEKKPPEKKPPVRKNPTEESSKRSTKRKFDLVKNNDNNGQLFDADGRPFWQQKGKGLKGRPEIESGDLTDDELPINAEVILDVYAKKIKLVDMPNLTITLDPFAPYKMLEERENVFFTRNIIFSNTARSMMNLGDCTTSSETGQRKGAKSKGGNAKLRWGAEPIDMGVYEQNKPRKITKKPFVRSKK
ncbi:hypothetical protein QR680_008546 [Steinernema hermaphroditum]|uniref:Uncharacterized protein n=1 Tax=Steinernema hermaphroditum TaxID=289476 RepID=A0AA39IH07_9BILA|nr:hypothetical protein QR680_008546 [Steinernema hermaphroditum]